MKKRIIISSLITVLFSLILVSASFLTLINMYEIQRTNENLGIYNNFFIEELKKGDVNLEQYKINNKNVRFTIISKNGTVLYDTSGNIQENHLDREEIKSAFLKGNGFSVRYSKTESANLVYYATKINEDVVIRSSVKISTISVFLSGALKYYILIVIIVAMLSLGLSIKLAKVIIYPIKELENVTDKISAGDLNRRAKIYNDDEIGSLARTFNKMAEELQIKINDSLDKQGKLEAILESMDSGVIALDNADEIMLINPHSKKLFGLKGKIIGQNITECIIDHELIRFIKSIPEVNSKEIKVFHPIEREIRVKKAPIINEHSNTIGTVISLSDITDIKRLENMRSQFVANVSHELKTPLTSIKGFAETLKYVEDDDNRNKFLDIINNEADRLSRLINDILSLSNIENMYMIKNESFNPKEVFLEVIEMIKLEANDKNVSITFDYNYNGSIKGDRDKFCQLGVNLIENAVKYSKKNGEVKIIVSEIKDIFVLEVIDNGIGIPKEDLPRIFERFYRVDKSRATKGTGLGLAIVKHIVKLFNGEIEVISTLGEGSKFTVKIKK